MCMNHLLFTFTFLWKLHSHCQSRVVFFVQNWIVSLFRSKLVNIWRRLIIAEIQGVSHQRLKQQKSLGEPTVHLSAKETIIRIEWVYKKTIQCPKERQCGLGKKLKALSLCSGHPNLLRWKVNISEITMNSWRWWWLGAGGEGGGGGVVDQWCRT